MQEPSRKKRGPWFYISVVSCLMVVIAVVTLVFSQNNLSDVGQVIAGAKENKPTIETTELQAPFETVQLFAETYTASHTSYIIEYPQVEDESFNETILHYINNEKETFLALADQNDNASKDAPNSFKATVDSYKFKERFYSFTFHTTTELGNEESVQHVSTFVYDAETAQIQTLEQLLNSNIRYLETFTQYVHEQLLADGHLVDDVALENVVTSNWESYSTFAIENDELVVYFQPGEVTDKTQEIVSISGEMSYLQSILAEQFHSELTEGTETLALIVDNRKRVALTFDDGPHPKVTNQILAILDEFDAKATFFMLGKNINKYPEIAKDVLAGGHEIGNHSWTHPVLTKLALDEAESEFTNTENFIVDTLGQHSTVFRPPFGAINDDIRALIPIPSVNWSLDTLDWKHRNPQKTLKIIKANMHNNAVILLHDIHQPTADGLREIMQYLEAEGYEFLTVSEVMPYVDFNM